MPSQMPALFNTILLMPFPPSLRLHPTGGGGLVEWKARCSGFKEVGGGVGKEEEMEEESDSRERDGANKTARNQPLRRSSSGA